MIRICKFCNKEFSTYKKTQVYCSISCNTRWRYANKPFSLFVKGYKGRLGMKMSEDFKKRRSREGNPMWRGTDVTFRSLHCWVRDNFLKLSKCEFCGREYTDKDNRFFDWSNKEHNYTGESSRNRDNWQFLCRSCHMKYDYGKGFRTPVKGPRVKYDKD